MNTKTNFSSSNFFSFESQINSINNNENNDSKRHIKKSTNKRFIGKKYNMHNLSLYSNYPGITHFNSNSFFIYDLGNIKDFLIDIKNKNTVKLNSKELSLIKEEIDSISNDVDIANNENFVNISLDEINKINEYFQIDITNNKIINWVNEFINKSDEREKISLEKIINIFHNDIGEIISKAKMYNIFKNKLKLRYLKTSIKNSKIKSSNFVFSSMCFIKILVRAINIGFKIYFMDESDISLKNNNFRCWRKNKELIYHNCTKNKRSNLLLIVDSNSVIYYKINNNPTNEKTFLEFMDEFLKIKKKDLNNKFILVLDNLACHKTSKVKQYFYDNKINVVFNTPYFSVFNCVELSFRYLKRHLYSNLFNNLEDAENEVKKLLEKEDIKATLKKNYRETLTTYLTYYLKHQNINLNNLNYDL